NIAAPALARVLERSANGLQARKERCQKFHPNPEPFFHRFGNPENFLLLELLATAEDFDKVVQTMLAGKVPTESIKTHTAPLRDIPARLVEWIRPEAGVIKAMIEI
ncbi:MAG: hypothetical protein POG24_07025, partial [Acidocella sp.]|nr:hypothetical protein [Acidocella sp.]